MKQIGLKLALVLVALACSVTASDIEVALDSNVAFFEGETLNYIVYPPTGFRMVDWEATADGYSFAFIPENRQYDSAGIVIGANLFKIRGLDYETVVTGDTTAMREHYGEAMSIWPVDSVFTASGQPVETYFVNHPDGFIPNVMISYVDGITELLVIELIVDDRVSRVIAEDRFVECLEKLRLLPAGQLGYNK